MGAGVIGACQMLHLDFRPRFQVQKYSEPSHISEASGGSLTALKAYEVSGALPTTHCNPKRQKTI